MAKSKKKVNKLTQLESFEVMRFLDGQRDRIIDNKYTLADVAKWANEILKRGYPHSVYRRRLIELKIPVAPHRPRSTVLESHVPFTKEELQEFMTDTVRAVGALQNQISDLKARLAKLETQKLPADVLFSEDYKEESIS